MPQVLIETRLNSLKLCESAQVRKGCLGRLEGICADFVNPTRNGRYYSRELWENVFNDDLVKEALETKTLIGELDHPEERFETLAQEACVVMTDYKFNDDTLTGGFDILDTQKGRTLKALLDYGCVMGVSSRGQGDLSSNGEYESVDPNTYDFMGFDVVLTPAVKRARQKVTENNKKKSVVATKLKPLTESLSNEINATNSVDSLDSIKKLIESANLPNSAELISAIDIRRKSIEEGKTIPEKLKKDLRVAKTKNTALSKKLESLTAETVREKENLNKTISTMTSKILAYQHREKRLAEAVTIARKENVKLIRKVENAKDVSKTANEALKLERNKCRSYETRISKLNSKLSNLSESISSKNDIISSLRSELSAEKVKVSKLSNTCESLKKSSSRNKSLNETIERDKIRALSENRNLKRQLKTALFSYATARSAKYGLTESTVKSIVSNCSSIEEINKSLKEVAERNDRYATLPFTNESSKTSLVENVDIKSTVINEEDAETERFLKAAFSVD